MRILATIVLALAVPFSVIAPARAAEADAEGAREHPLFGRFPGSVIAEYTTAKKAAYVLPAGPLADGKPGSTKDINGTLTRITYKAAGGGSAGDILAFYEDEFKKAGFETLYAAGGEALSRGSDWAEAFYHDLYALHGETKNQRFLSASRSSPDGEVYAALYVSHGWYACPVAQLDIVEVKREASERARRDGALSRRLRRDGCAVVRGLAFEEGGAQLAAGAEAALREVAEAVAAMPDRKFYLVCHTDSSPGLERGMALSRERAEAAVKALVERHRVPPGLVTAQGVGPLCPAGDNRTREGRDRNCRVELVAQ